MKKPNDFVLRLYNDCMDSLTAIKIDYKQTGVDTAETFLTITGYEGDGMEGKKTKTVKYDNVKNLYDFRIDYNSVGKMKCSVLGEVEEWIDYEEKNKEEYNDYLRLKRKFEND